MPECYVCHKPVTKGVYLMNDVWRHFDCYPGSKTWMNSEVGKASKLRKHFLTYYNKEDIDEEGQILGSADEGRDRERSESKRKKRVRRLLRREKVNS